MKVKIFLLVVWFLPFFITSLFNQPAIDDFWSANTINNHGRTGAIAFLYRTVSARYFSNFIMSILNTLPVGQVWIFKTWPMLVLIFLLASFWFFYRSFLTRFMSKQQIILCAFLFVALYVANMRTLFEGLYWMSSTVCYQIAVCIFVIGIGSIIRYLKKPSVLYAITAISACLLLPGTVELLAPVYIFTLIIILLISFKQQYNLKLTAVCLALSLAATAITAFSSGNLSRVHSDSFVYNQNIFFALFYAARSVIFYALTWTVKPVNIAFLFLMIPALFNLSKKITYPSLPMLKPFTMLIVLFLTGIVIYLPLAYFESSVPFPRVTTLFFFVSAHLAVLIIFLFLKKMPAFFNKAEKIFSPAIIEKSSWILVFIALFTCNNFTAVVKDLYTGTAYNFNIESNNRFTTIKNCKSDTCYVFKYLNWPVFAQSSKEQDADSRHFYHENKFFGKVILYVKD